MVSTSSEQKKYTLLNLLTEAGKIIMTIKEKANSDEIILPRDPLNLVKQALETEPPPQTKEELEEALRNILQGLQIDALIEYSSILNEFNNNLAEKVFDPNDPRFQPTSRAVSKHETALERTPPLS